MAYTLTGRKGGTVRFVPFENGLVEKESESYSSSVTSNPVESGADINDHVNNAAGQLTISGTIVGGDSAINALKAMRESRDIITYTGVIRMTNLVFTSLKFDRSYKNRNGASFSATLKQVRLVTSEYVPMDSEVLMSSQDAGKTDNQQLTKTTSTGMTTASLQSVSSASAEHYRAAYIIRRSAPTAARCSCYAMSASTVSSVSPATSMRTPACAGTAGNRKERRTMYPDGEVDCLHCGSCKFFGHVGPKHTPCQKRIDHVSVRFAHPWFKTYDCNQFTGVICSDFEPAERCVYLARTWRGFDYYWPQFLDQWGGGQGKTGDVVFTLDGNTKVRYFVKTEYFVYGDKLFVDGKLNAHARQFYVVDRRSPIGYRLVTQPWNPFAQPQTEGERIRAEILNRRKETAV